MTLLLILLAIAAGVALLVLLGERHFRPLSPRQQQRLQRWLWPLVGASLVLALLDHYL